MGSRKATPHFQSKRFTQSSRINRTRMMFDALYNGNTPMVKLLLKEGGLRTKARSRANNSQTLLHAAVYFRYPKVVRQLVLSGCLVNAIDDLYYTPLHIAIMYRKVKVVSELIRLGANVNAKIYTGETSLHLAIGNTTSEVDLIKIIPNCDSYVMMRFYGMRSLLRQNFMDKERTDSKRLASKNKTIEGVDHLLVKMLLDAGADVNAAQKDTNECTPIQCAVYTGDLELMKTLIDAGANIDHQNSDGITALHGAVLCCNEEMVLLLLNRGAKVTLETKYHGHTALHWAAMLNIDNSYERIIRHLMEFGSDLNKKNSKATTPFNYIVQFGDVNLVHSFIDEYNVDLNRLRTDESSALVYAAQNMNEKVMDLVLKSGIEVDYKCESGETPLHFASRMSLLKNVQKLISKGADVNAKDIIGRTPLIRCVFESPNYYDHRYLINLPLVKLRHNFGEERRRVIRLLLECGANVNNDVRNSFQETIFEMAIRNRDIHATEMIIEYAAEFEARTNKSLFEGRNLMVIEAIPEVKGYYQDCRDELKIMRTSKIEGSVVSYLSMLTERLAVVARYARNMDLVKKFEANLESSFPIYGKQLKEKFEAASFRQKTMEKVSAVLSETLRFADPTNVAFEIIFEQLNETDVELLIGKDSCFESLNSTTSFDKIDFKGIPST